MGTIYYDNTKSTLIENRIWQIRPTPDDEANPEIVRAEVVSENCTPLYQCARSKKHVTSYRVDSVVVELFGTHLLDFVSIDRWWPLLVSEKFAYKLEASGLVGAKVRSDVLVQPGYNSAPPASLRFLEFTFVPLLHPRWRIGEADNLCPFCKAEPIVCDGCCQYHHSCPNCGCETIVATDASSDSKDVRLRFDSLPDKYVVDAALCAGIDWFQTPDGVFISNRAKEWLEDINAVPREIRPALLDS